MNLEPLFQIALSAGLGLLLGLQRERTDASIAGIRTFPLISVFGTICAQISHLTGGWVIAAGLLSLAAILVLANVARLKVSPPDPGMTTEIAALVLFGLGVLLVVGSVSAAIVAGGAVTLLLHAKEPLHRFAKAVGDRDMRAIMQFVVLTLIILPILPDQAYGPDGVWNPFRLWLMVVLIVGISLTGYVAYKLFGARAGALLGGIIGGLVSSTATTVSFARRAVGQTAIAPLAAMVIMIASCISFFRVLAEIAAVAPSVFFSLAPPIAVMFAVCCLLAAILYVLSRNHSASMPEQKNPAELKSALIFGALYALVLLAVALAGKYLGNAGLFVVGTVSGLTDMDAITLSTAQLAGSGELLPHIAWRVILVAALANFVFKFGIVATIGPAALTRRIGSVFAVAALCGGLLIWLWPA